MGNSAPPNTFPFFNPFSFGFGLHSLHFSEDIKIIYEYFPLINILDEKLLLVGRAFAYPFPI